MAKTKTNVKDLKNISKFGKLELAKWGVIGAIILFAYFLVAVILTNIIGLGWLFGLIGLCLGVLYLVLGVFGVISTVRKQEGKYWGFFLAGAILAILTPLGWFGYAGLAISILAGAMFLTYILLEKK